MELRGRRIPRLASALALLQYISLATAVALSDFSPRIDSLPANCELAYTNPINGCQTSDFTNAAHTCSPQCLEGLVQINALVGDKCKDVDVEETSIIGLFQLGKAIQLLCSVAVVTTTTGGPGAPAAAATTPLGTGTMVLSSAPLVTSGMLTDTSPLSPPAANSVAPASATVPSATPLSPPLTPLSTPASSLLPTDTVPVQGDLPRSKPGSTGRPQASATANSGENVGSGGGSPFDEPTNSGAAAWVRSGSASMFAAVLVAAMAAWTST